MSIRTKLLLIIWSLLTGIAVIFAYLLNDLQKSEYLASIDAKLDTAALMARSVMSEDYHDGIVNANSINKQDYLKIIDRYNKICLETGMQYLWSNLILEQNRIVFTSSTSTSKDIANGDHAQFFDVHSDPGAFDGVIKAKKTHFSTFVNEWGSGRMVLKPFHDRYGRMYVFGASIDINELNQKLFAINRDTAIILVLFLLGGTILSVLISRKISHSLARISSHAKDISSGNYGKHLNGEVTDKDFEELHASIDEMSDSIHSEHTNLSKQLHDSTNLLNKQVSYANDIFESLAEVIITINSLGVIEYANPTALETFDYQKNDFVGQHINLIMADSITNNHSTYLAAPEIYLNTIINTRRELRAKRRNGDIFPVELNLTSMQTHSGLKYVGILHDITEQVATREKLQKAKEEAERANNAKSEFISSMSHELRTPLNSIIGFSQLCMMESTTEEDIKRDSEEIYKAGNHLLDLINEILDLARIESGKIEINLEAIRICDLIEECILYVKSMPNKLNISFQTDHNCPEGICVNADKVRLKQVILNLLSNAVKYNTENGTVTISGALISPDKLKVTVTDTGLGLSEWQQSQLFQRFNRLGHENSTIEGSGIGLAITQELITKMNGEIGVSSEVDEGSTFWITLPVSKELAKNEENQNIDGLQISNKTFKSLYVEDNVSSQLVLQKMLEKAGIHNLHIEGSAESALNYLVTNTPDLIFLDLDLPGMNGFEFFERIKSVPKLTNTPVIAVTANAMHEDIEIASTAGFHAYLTKPVDYAKLCELIEKLVSA